MSSSEDRDHPPAAAGAELSQLVQQHVTSLHEEMRALRRITLWSFLFAVLASTVSFVVCARVARSRDVEIRTMQIVIIQQQLQIDRLGKEVNDLHTRGAQ